MHQRVYHRPNQGNQATSHTQGRIDATSLTREISQEEQAQHASAEDGRQGPPSIQGTLGIHERKGHQSTQYAHQYTRHLQHHELFLIACLLTEVLVIVRENHRRRAGDARSYRTHTGRKDRGNQQTGHTHRKFIHDEEREHEIGTHIGRKKLRMNLIERIQARTNEEEDGRYRDEQISPEQGREFRFLHVLGGMVSLHIVLVDAIVLKVREDAINHAHPEGRFAQASTEATQAELVVFHGNAEGLHRSFGHIEEEQHEAEQCTPDKDNPLNGLRPDYRLDASHHGVSHNGHRSDEDNGLDVPPQEFVHRQSQEVKNGTHAGYLREEIERRGIHSRPSSETLLQEAIGRYALLVPIERHEILGRKERGDRDGKAEHKRIPIARKGLARITQVTDATHISSEDGHAHHPTGKTPPGRGKLIRRAFLLEKRTPEEYHSPGEQQEYDNVYDMHKSINYYNNIVIQSEAKDLEDTHIDALEILHYTSFRSE